MKPAPPVTRQIAMMKSSVFSLAPDCGESGRG